jgi:hypothetical protein
VDRCALFVDAGYVLADGAMAVHGTRQRASVSWDYAGLVKLLTGLSRDRTGLPVLRCYWYEATLEGRRSSEHNTLADLPGVKLRLGRVRPGRREGVEAEIQRDLTTLARNRAVSDAVIVSAEEDLTEVVAEVQDLGLRVVIVHIAAQGSWTVPGPLRQESDDIVEISGAHLRPFVDLIAADEPADHDEQYRNGNYQRRAMANGHGTGLGAVTHQGLPAAALPPPPQIYTTPVVEDYQRSSAGTSPSASTPQPQAQAPSQAAAAPQAQAPAQHQASADTQGQAAPAQGVAPPAPPAVPAPQSESRAQPQVPAQPAAVSRALAAQAQDLAGAPAHAGQQAPPAPRPQPPAGPEPQPFAQPQPPAQAQPVLQAAAQPQELSAPPQPPAPQAPPSQPPARHVPAVSQPLAAPTPPGGYGPPPGAPWPQEAVASVGRHGPSSQPPPQAGQGGARFGPGEGDYRSPDQAGSAQGRFGELPPAPQRFDGPAQGRFEGPAEGRFGEPAAQGRFADSPAALGRFAEGPPSGRYAEGPAPGRYAEGPPPARFGDNSGPAPYPPVPPGTFGAAPVPYSPQYPGAQPGQHGAGGPEPGYAPRSHEQDPYSEPQAAAHSALPQPVPQPMAMSLSDAVQAAHGEGFGFGDAVARDAPALWLEAVLARKPRMPSDLEARLLQGSALPIDSLLHDEVRHSLRRGFWDALERSRR